MKRFLFVCAGLLFWSIVHTAYADTGALFDVTAKGATLTITKIPTKALPYDFEHTTIQINTTDYRFDTSTPGCQDKTCTFDATHGPVKLKVLGQPGQMSLDLLLKGYKSSPVIEKHQVLIDSSVLVSVGYIGLAGAANEPFRNAFLVQSTDAGSSWEEKTITGLRTGGELLQASCTGYGTKAFCVAVGFSYSAGNIFPLLVQSTNGGNSWEMVTIPNLPQDGKFFSISCLKERCSAVGYSESGFQREALVVQTMNGGASWEKRNVPDMPKNTLLTSTSCAGTTDRLRCVAVGGIYEGKDSPLPLLIQSTGDGSSWQIKSISGLPTTTELHSVSCIGSGETMHCVAVGNTPSSPYTGLILQTINDGNSWEVKSIPQPLKSAYLPSVSCSGQGAATRCVAAGHTAFSPLLLQSMDGGSTWALKDVSGLTQRGMFSSVSCTGEGSKMHCVAAGRDIDADAPILAQSQDGGSNWKSVSVPQLPKKGRFYAASCTEIASVACCVAVGENRDTDAPLFVQTTDGGATWSTPDINKLPQEGGFEGTGASQSDTSGE